MGILRTKPDPMWINLRLIGHTTIRCFVIRILTALYLLLIVGCEKGTKMPDSDKYITAPRHPPAHTFPNLPAVPFELGSQEYLSIVPNLVRYRDWGPNGAEDIPAWNDEEQFASWLDKQAIPQILAEFLYQNAPERSLMINAGHLKGVGELIEGNSDASFRAVRAAGFFMVGSGPNGDILVVDLENKGATGFLPLEMVFSKSPQELRELFIPIAPSLG